MFKNKKNKRLLSVCNKIRLFFFFAGITLSDDPKSYILFEMNEILSRYLYTMFEHFATRLITVLIARLENDAFCAEGICYYTSCKHELCLTQYCEYHLVRGETKCSATKPAGSFEFNQLTLLPVLSNIERKNKLLKNEPGIIKTI